ncbi:hypothetical protein DHEL01_v213074, partial [Diaporthe helianthi]
ASVTSFRHGTGIKLVSYSYGSCSSTVRIHTSIPSTLCAKGPATPRILSWPLLNPVWPSTGTRSAVGRKPSIALIKRRGDPHAAPNIRADPQHGAPRAQAHALAAA